MKLVRKQCGTEVRIGEILTDFRGEGGYKVVGMREPHRVGSTGKVLVEGMGGFTRELFPGVFGLEWRQDD